MKLGARQRGWQAEMTSKTEDQGGRRRRAEGEEGVRVYEVTKEPT